MMNFHRCIATSLLPLLFLSVETFAFQEGNADVIIQLNGLPAARLQPATRSTNVEPEQPSGTLATSGRPANSSSVVKFNNGDFLWGEWVDSPKDKVIGWKCPAFANILEIQPSSLVSIDQQNVEVDVAFSTGMTFRTHAGDVLWGSPTAWDEEMVEILTPNIGLIRLKSESIRYAAKPSSAEKILYQEPFQLAKWKSAESNSWSVESGSLICRKLGGKIIGAAQLAEKCQIQLGFSWIGKPNFVIALGVPEDSMNSGRAFSIEVWDDKLALLRELPMKAEAAFLQSLDNKTTSIELTIYLDQITGRAIVFSNEGKMLADITLTSDTSDSHSFLSIENFCREFRLDQVRVLTWNGDIPAERNLNNNRIELVDGRVIEGKIIAFSSDRGWTIRTNDGEEIQAEVEDIRYVVTSMKTMEGKENELAKLNPKSSNSSNDLVTGAVNLAIREPMAIGESVGNVLLRNQTRLLGTWMHVRDGMLQFLPNSAVDSVQIPLKEIVSFRAAHRGGQQNSTSSEGAMYSETVQLRGNLLDSEAGSSSGLFRWSSPFLDAPAQLVPGVEGRFDFRRMQGAASLPVASAPAMAGPNPGARQPAITERASPRRVSMPNVRLRTGERFMAEVDQIDDRGVFFHSPSTAKGFVRNELIHAVELRSMRREKPLDPTKLERFLTIPRMRRDDPPTHVLISLEGDYLRGRLIQLTADETVIEINLSEVRVPTASIAQVVWLHDRKWSVSPPPTATTQIESDRASGEGNQDATENREASEKDRDEPEGTDQALDAQTFHLSRIHVSEKAGWSMNLEPLRIAGGILVGRSEILGEYAVDLKGVELILFGGNIESRANQLIENPWTLSLAKIPKVFEDADRNSEGADGPLGEDSKLVGKPAPKLEGEMLDGSKFVLAEHKGKIVVLDFWASWCGPCMQYMPLLDAAIEEIGNPDVELFAVNLEESSDRATAAMNRLKLNTRVVLDIDGVAGQRYEANAIPQTVIVDREGNVRHVFVGGGAQTVLQIRTAIEKLVAEQTGT